jgi:hypothetical protein
MQETIIWRTEDDGSIETITNSGHKTICKIISLKEGILWTISDYMLNWVRNPNMVKNNLLFTNIKHSFLSPLKMVYPRISTSKCDFIVNSIQKNMIEKLNEYITSLSLTDNSLSNFEFLLLLGKQRIWNNGCVICLDDVAGHKCNCGYNNVVICRPCGHSFCPQPCFEQILKSFGYKTIPINNDGSYTVRNYDLPYDKLVCPTCRTNISSVFCSQHIITDGLYKKLDIYDNVVSDLENFVEPEVVALPKQKLNKEEIREMVKKQFSELLNKKN